MEMQRLKNSCQFNLMYHAQPTEQQLEMMDRFEVPSSKTIENAARIFMTMLDEEQRKAPNLFSDIVCVLRCLVHKMHLSNQLLCYTAFILDKLLKTCVRERLFSARHFTYSLSLVFLIIQKVYRDHPYTVSALSKLFQRNLNSMANVEIELLTLLEFDLFFPSDVYETYKQKYIISE
jgi:hypothetical protein